MRSKRDEKMQNLERRIRSIRQGISMCLRGRGVVFEWSEHFMPRLAIEGYDMSFSLRPQYDHAGAGSLSTRLTLRFGDSLFERAVSQNEPKAGYNVEQIVDRIMARHAREAAWASMQADATKTAATNARVAACINHDLGLEAFVYEGGLVEKLEASGHGQGIQVTIDLVCDECKARSILAWVRKEITS